MDVSPCNSLLDLRFFALVLSRTLNGSSENKKDKPFFLRLQKAGRLLSGLFFVVCQAWRAVHIPAWLDVVFNRVIWR